MGQIRDLMTSNPTTCDATATVADAAKLMAREGVGPIPVVDGDRLVGLVTDRDIVVRVVAEGHDPSSTKLGDIASSDLKTVAPDDDLDVALHTMASAQVRRLPVVEDGRLVGIVAQADVARKGEDTRTGEVVEQISQ
jgi:CBS domain-containing protein